MKACAAAHVAYVGWIVYPAAANAFSVEFVPSQYGGTASVAPPGQQYFGSGSCGGGPDGEFCVTVPLIVPPLIVVPAFALPLIVELLLSVMDDVDDVPSPMTWI